MATIRRIRVEEAPRARELYGDAIRRLADRYPEDRIAISEQGLSNLETEFRLGAVHGDEATFVAEEEGDLVGFVTTSVSRGRGLPGVSGEIHELCTAKDGDHKRELVEAAMKWLAERGATTIFHMEDAEHPESDPWEPLGFEADVVRYSFYA